MDIAQIILEIRNPGPELSVLWAPGMNSDVKHEVKLQNVGPVKSQILVIDDEEEICQLLQVALDMAGHQVRYSTTASGGLELARIEPFDLAIVDMVMPQKDGLEVLEELQATHPDILTIIITGLHSTDILRKSLDAGAFGVLTKPFTLADIVELIETGNSIRGPAPPLQTLSPVMHQTVELRLPTTWPVTPKITSYLRDMARSFDFSRIISDRNIPMAVHELIQNAIVHGNKHKEDTTVTVRASVADRQMTVEVEDEGKGFDPSKIVTARAVQSGESKSWGGLSLVRFFSDELAYERNGRLARVTFKAIRQPKKTAASRSHLVKA